jgi:hypothetical protein
MTRITTGLIAAIAALSFAAAGCNKDKNKDAPAAGETGKPAAEAGKKAPDAPVVTAGSGGANFAAMPADAEFVMSFSLAGLRSSPMWGQIAPMVQAKLDAELKDVKEACGFDPMTKLQSIHLAGKPADEKNMLVVLKGFTKEEMATCGAAMAKKDSKEFVVNEVDGVTVVKSDGQDVHMVWIDKDTALMSPNPDVAWLKARAGGTGGLDGNAAFMEMAKKVDTSATVWFAAMPAAGGQMDMSKNVAGSKGYYASVKMADGLGIDAGMRFDTPENAKAALAMATSQLQQGKAMLPPALQSVVDKTKLGNAANDVSLQLQLSTADLQAIGAALGPMLGGMMGGMAK